MCGITGVVNRKDIPADPEIISAMATTIAHRGPDGKGVWTEGPVGLGHRRLAILDLSAAGAQPMRRGNLVITYNGEIYNFIELQRQLQQLGHTFTSMTDTEVILAAYQQWGRDCVSRFNGMFAFAIWDTSHKELFLARDRYGIKPLYYGFFGGTFLFGSEQKAILAHPAANCETDLEALLEYFTFQNFFTDKTLTKGIKMFPAGCTARITPEQSQTALQFNRYWDFDFREPETPLSENEYHEQLDFLFRQAVKRQLISDVEVGTYLSGGIDSGSITAVAAKERPYIKSFTCGFDLHSASGLELACDEREAAEYMSYLFKTEHYEMVLKSGDMERCMPKLAWHLEDPRVGQSYPNYYAAKLASKFVKVVMGGAGGDELFGGYPWRYYRAAVCANFEDYIDKYYLFWQRLIPNREIHKVFAPVWNDVKHVWTRDIFRDVLVSRKNLPVTPEQAVNNSLYFEAKTFLHGLLVVEDKLSMAHGLEARVPFLDNDLVDFAMRMPVSLKLDKLAEVVRLNENEVGPKVNRYYQKTRDGKMALRRVLERHVPAKISNGVKRGFSAPDASWFKGESINYVTELLIKGDAKIYEYLDKNAVRALVLEHLEGKQNRRLLIWSLLNMENWLNSDFGQADTQ
ncbi:MAG: asparagine synthase (glutamine-hydrolyzing) [Desulfobulbaceae bacterium]|nr:asparagine synthase (glutamine-hydrolyzing) [Desulfobulbaceae bacterium]